MKYSYQQAWAIKIMITVWPNRTINLSKKSLYYIVVRYLLVHILWIKLIDVKYMCLNAVMTDLNKETWVQSYFFFLYRTHLEVVLPLEALGSIRFCFFVLFYFFSCTVEFNSWMLAFVLSSMAVKSLIHTPHSLFQC